MSDYDDLIISDNPAIFPNIDLVGAAVDGQTIEDRSVNAFSGTLVYTATGGEQALGFPPAVETDAAAREFRGWTNANIILGLTGTSRIEFPNDSLLQPTGDCTMECWVRPLADIPAAGDFILTGKSGTMGIYLTSSGGTRLGGFLIDSGDNLHEVMDLSFLVTDFIGTPFYVAVFRAGNALGLQVNDAVRATTTITGGLPTKQSTNPFVIHPNTGFALGARYCKPAFYTYALSGAQRTAHYEAGINATLLNGDSNVVSSAILYSDVEPAPIQFPFRHNWTDSLIERISFRTNQSVARKGYSENAITRPKPRREIEISQMLRDNNERTRLRSQLTAQQNRKWFIPILEDREQLTTTLASGSTTIPVTTQYRDYEVDSWAELRQLNAAGEIVKSEVVQVTAVNVGDIGTTATVNTYDALLSTVSPARRGKIGNTATLRGHSGAVEELPILARLVAEDEKVTPNRIIPWTPDLTYKDYEVYNPDTWQSNNWVELRDYDITREQETVDFDAGSFEDESDALAAVEVFSYRMLLEGRDKIAALLGWFYARAGAARYLWVPTMQADFNIVSVASPAITVVGHNYSNNFAGSEFRRDLAFVYEDNSMVLRRINSVAVAGANETLSLDAAVPSLTDLRSLSYLRFCQLDSDTLEIARVTDTKARFAWAFRELLGSPD